MQIDAHSSPVTKVQPNKTKYKYLTIDSWSLFNHTMMIKKFVSRLPSFYLLAREKKFWLHTVCSKRKEIKYCAITDNYR